MPNLPSIADTLPGYSAGVWFGLFAPANTPKPIVDKLNAAMLKALQSQDVKQNLAAQGVEPIGGTPDGFAKVIKDDSKRWTQIANQVDLTK